VNISTSRRIVRVRCGGDWSLSIGGSVVWLLATPNS